jgi:3-hydroxyacyl-CoA dehydrogenase
MQNAGELKPGSKVVVVGAGLMGAQIAAEYALAGYSVMLSNRTRESAEEADRRAVGA